MVERQYHEAWHTLFANRTPLEIVVFLIEKKFAHGMVKTGVIHTQWQGREESYSYFYRKNTLPFEPWTLRPTQARAWMILFGERSEYSILHEILNGSRWAPEGYFISVHITIQGGSTIELDFEE